VPDTDETAWQHMQQETTQELSGRQCQQAFPVLVSGISPAKRNPVIYERNKTMVGDRHPMCVGSEITEHAFWSAERRLRIDQPAQGEQLAD
jgi:hypothetical protein